MLLSALLLAAAVQGGPSPASPTAPVALRSDKDCRRSGVEYAERAAGPPKVKKLGDLPPANHTLTVLRSVDGCPVSSTIRFNVDLPARR